MKGCHCRFTGNWKIKSRSPLTFCNVYRAHTPLKTCAFQESVAKIAPCIAQLLECLVPQWPAASLCCLYELTTLQLLLKCLNLGNKKPRCDCLPTSDPSIMTRRLVLYSRRRSPTSVIAHICFMWTCDRKEPHVHLLGSNLFCPSWPPPTKSPLTHNNTGHMKRWL